MVNAVYGTDCPSVRESCGIRKSFVIECVELLATTDLDLDQQCHISYYTHILSCRLLEAQESNITFAMFIACQSTVCSVCATCCNIGNFCILCTQCI